MSSKLSLTIMQQGILVRICQDSESIRGLGKPERNQISSSLIDDRNPQIWSVTGGYQVIAALPTEIIGFIC